ncbi:MAG: nuclear transport factor 2 family protein [Anaerolineales bacterium]
MSEEPAVIRSVEQLIALWERTYNESGRPDWSHLLPYYADDIHFVDTVQEIHGIAAFREMVERLTRRSGELRMKVLHAVKEENVIFLEWEMTILFRNTRTSVLAGASRLTLNSEGKIAFQRDYYDLWGTIFDNIPGMRKGYRAFMRRAFG